MSAMLSRLYRIDRGPARSDRIREHLGRLRNRVALLEIVCRLGVVWSVLLLLCSSPVCAATEGPLSGASAEAALIGGGVGGGISGFILQEWANVVHVRGEVGAFGVSAQGGPVVVLLGSGELGYPVSVAHNWTMNLGMGADVVGMLDPKPVRCDPIGGCVSPRLQPYGGLGAVMRSRSGASLDLLVAATYACVLDTCAAVPRLRLVGITRKAWLLGVQVEGDPQSLLSLRAMVGWRFLPSYHQAASTR